MDNQFEGKSLEQRMLIDTMGIFSASGPVTLSAERGILLIEGWLNALQGNVGTERIISEMEKLRDLLKENDPDDGAIRSILLNLSLHTHAIASQTDDTTEKTLKQLSDSLYRFSNQ